MSAQKRIVAVITCDGKVEPREQNIPVLNENEVLIKVHNSLISPGTEMNCVKERRAGAGGKSASECTFGYANAGEIIGIKGKGGELEKGMRVAAMGGGACHANYACVPVSLVVPIPGNVSYEQAAYACLGATALQSVRRTEPLFGEYGIVLGLGIIGNISAQLYMLSGARIIGWEAISSRIEIAKRCGLKDAMDIKNEDLITRTKYFTSSYGMDFALFAFGADANSALNSVNQCMKVSADGHIMGRLVLVGGCQMGIRGGASLGNMDIRISSRTGPGYHDSDYEHGCDYPAGFVQFTTQRNLREIVRLISEKRLLVDPMTTHKMPLSEAGKAANLLIEHPDQALGVVFEMSR